MKPANDTTGGNKPPITEGPELPKEGQTGKSLPLESLSRAPETAPLADNAPSPEGTANGSQLPPEKSNRFDNQPSAPATAPGVVVQPSEAPAKSDGKRTSKAVQDTHGAGSLAALAAAAMAAAAGGKGDSKETRGKRYLTLRSVRHGLTLLANELAGRTDPKTAAVRLQTLQAIANVLVLEEQARLDTQTAQIEAQIKAKGGAGA